jgi:dihydrofolate reductase
MRKLRIMEHISLDGVLQHSADNGDFPYGDWTAPYRTPAGRDAILAAHGESFDLLLGRRTYDIWSGFWPKAPSSPMADGLNAAKKYIATHRPESLEWGPFEGALDRTSSRAFAASSRRTARTLSSGVAPR